MSHADRDKKIKEHQKSYVTYRSQTRKRKGGRGRFAGRAKLQPVERTSEMMAREMELKLDKKINRLPVAQPHKETSHVHVVDDTYQAKRHTCNRCGCILKNRLAQTRFCRLCLPIHVNERRRALTRINRQTKGRRRKERRAEYQQVYRQEHKAERREWLHGRGEYQKLRDREHARRMLGRRTDIRRWTMVFTGQRDKIRDSNDINLCRRY